MEGAQQKRQKAPDMVGKWGEEVASRGFSQIPNYLILINQFLDEDNKLAPLELLILIELVGTWWKKDDPPFPSMKTLADRCGTSERQVLRAVTKLEEKDLLKRVKRRNKGIIASNAYDLQPLVDMLGEIAKRFPNAFPRTIR